MAGTVEITSNNEPAFATNIVNSVLGEGYIVSENAGIGGTTIVEWQVFLWWNGANGYLATENGFDRC